MPFQAVGRKRQDVSHMVAGREDIGVAEHQEGTGAGFGHQMKLRLEHRDQRSFRADQGAGDVKVVFGQ